MPQRNIPDDANVVAAEIGDTGTVFDVLFHGSISDLYIQTGPKDFRYVRGDTRMVCGIMEALAGQEVEVVESEGSGYGCHSVLPLEEGYQPLEEGYQPLEEYLLADDDELQ